MQRGKAAGFCPPQELSVENEESQCDKSPLHTGRCPVSPDSSREWLRGSNLSHVGVRLHVSPGPPSPPGTGQGLSLAFANADTLRGAVVFGRRVLWLWRWRFRHAAAGRCLRGAVHSDGRWPCEQRRPREARARARVRSQRRSQARARPLLPPGPRLGPEALSSSFQWGHPVAPWKSDPLPEDRDGAAWRAGKEKELTPDTQVRRGKPAPWAGNQVRKTPGE